MINRRHLLRSTLALGIGGVAGFAFRRDHEPPNVLLIILDALRADHVGTGLTPTIEALARRGTVFENCYSASTQTKTSMASILTGTYPPYHGVRTMDNGLPQMETLAELFRRNEYRTVGIVTNPWLTPETGAPGGYEQGFESYKAASFMKKGPYRRYDWVAPVFGREMALNQGPTFTYVHLMETHNPWVVHDSPDLPVVERAFSTPETLTEPEHTRVRTIYREAAARADRAVKMMLERLDRPTVVIVTGDHGEELYERGHYGHCRPPSEELVRVPLVIAGPGIPRGARGGAVSNVALYDTLRSLLGFKQVVRESFFESLFDTASSNPLLAEFVSRKSPLHVYRMCVWPTGVKAVIETTLEGELVAEDFSRLAWAGGDTSPVAVDEYRQKLETKFRQWARLGERDMIAHRNTSHPWQKNWVEEQLSPEDAEKRRQLQTLGYLQ